LFEGKNVIGDDLFPTIALFHLPPAIGIIFIIALISALFPSADGALTALTSSFCIDILGIRRKEGLSEASQKRTRIVVHLSFAVIFLFCIMLFKWIDNKSIIGIILDLAGYTYGPLLGLFAFGLFTKTAIKDRYVPFVCVASPIITFVLETQSQSIFGGFGFAKLILNGAICYLLLWSIREKAKI
jgi:Na+/proline symporter